MGVAGSGGEVLELAECGAPADAGPERGHHVGQGGDGLLSEQGDDGVGGELAGSHCGTIADSDRRIRVTREHLKELESRSGCSDILPLWDNLKPVFHDCVHGGRGQVDEQP